MQTTSRPTRSGLFLLIVARRVAAAACSVMHAVSTECYLHRYEEYIPLKKRRAMEEHTRLVALGKVRRALLTSLRLPPVM